MITVNGYSKDPSIMPDGIVITFGKDMINDQGGIKTFLKGWLSVFNDEDSTWKHYCRNRPSIEVLYVYIIVLNRLAYRCQYICYEEAKPNVPRYKANNEWQPIVKPGILMSAPLMKCPFKRELKGFQGFRYCTKLF